MLLSFLYTTKIATWKLFSKQLDGRAHHLQLINVMLTEVAKFEITMHISVALSWTQIAHDDLEESCFSSSIVTNLICANYNVKLSHYTHHGGLTIQIRDSIVAPKLTLLKMILSGPYQKLSSSSCKMGGERLSVSGNLRTTSTSFSTGFNSGLQEMDSVNAGGKTFQLHTAFPAF
jgi:hypothetical protein